MTPLGPHPPRSSGASCACDLEWMASSTGACRMSSGRDQGSWASPACSSSRPRRWHWRAWSSSHCPTPSSSSGVPTAKRSWARRRSANFRSWTPPCRVKPTSSSPTLRAACSTASRSPGCPASARARTSRRSSRAAGFHRRRWSRTSIRSHSRTTATTSSSSGRVASAGAGGRASSWRPRGAAGGAKRCTARSAGSTVERWPFAASRRGVRSTSSRPSASVIPAAASRSPTTSSTCVTSRTSCRRWPRERTVPNCSTR